jgi:hypothetical protein
MEAIMALRTSKVALGGPGRAQFDPMVEIVPLMTSDR